MYCWNKNSLGERLQRSKKRRKVSLIRTPNFRLDHILETFDLIFSAGFPEFPEDESGVMKTGNQL
jgi:hypothetical protein